MDNLLRLVHVLGNNLNNEITMRQLSKDSNIPYTTTSRLLTGNKEIFVVNQKGNIKLCSLNKRDNLTKNYLVLSERNAADRFLKKNPGFKMLKDELPQADYCVILFGSRAEGTNRTKSDVDICIINKEGKRDVKFSKFELLFKLEVNAVFMSNKEFKQMLTNKEDLANEIIRKHIILHGEEYFWNLVWAHGI